MLLFILLLTSAAQAEYIGSNPDNGVYVVQSQKWDFTLGSVNVKVCHDIRDVKDKKAYLIEVLKEYDEGVVIYDANAPHAIWLFGYDAETDTFYCADTTTSVAGRAITLQESILSGKTAEDKINTIDRIWRVTKNI